MSIQIDRKETNIKLFFLFASITLLIIPFTVLGRWFEWKRDKGITGNDFTHEYSVGKENSEYNSGSLLGFFPPPDCAGAGCYYLDLFINEQDYKTINVIGWLGRVAVLLISILTCSETIKMLRKYKYPFFYIVILYLIASVINCGIGVFFLDILSSLDDGFLVLTTETHNIFAWELEKINPLGIILFNVLIFLNIILFRIKKTI